jgi:hypothetical protein
MKRAARLTALVAAVLTLAMTTGCVENDTPPTFRESAGTVSMSSVVTAADVSPQQLTEYGVFYSKNRDDIVAVNGVSYTSNLLSDEDFVVRDGVQRISVPTTMSISASQSGNMQVQIPGLSPNTTYYFRFYTVGYDQDDVLWKFALKVAEYTTVSTDATLKSLKPSPGKLSPKFSKSRTKYTVSVSAKTKKVTVRVAPSVSRSKVQLRVGSGKWKTTKSATASPKRGSSRTVYIRVTATNGKTVKAYSVKVKRRK